MKKLYIVRDKWLRGEGPSSSFLIRKSDKKQCCLGFACRKAGMKIRDLVDMARPRTVVKATNIQLPDWAKWLIEDPCMVRPEVNQIEQMMLTNDDMNIEDSEREEKLIGMFAEVGVELIFV